MSMIAEQLKELAELQARTVGSIDKIIIQRAISQLKHLNDLVDQYKRMVR